MVPSIKEIVGFPNYLVTNTGVVINRKRSKTLKPCKGSQGGYLAVSLGKGNPRYIHRLVAETFIDRPEGSNEVNHIDGNKLNNRADNLEWCTRSHNNKHAFAIGLRESPSLGKKFGDHPTAKPVVQMDLSGNVIRSWSSGTEAIESGVGSANGISMCCSGKIKKHAGFKWQYAS